jgi:hypothetical protein
VYNLNKIFLFLEYFVEIFKKMMKMFKKNRKKKRVNLLKWKVFAESAPKRAGLEKSSS